MKKLISYISLVTTLAILSCNKDALNKGPLNLYSDNNIWKDSALISRVVLQAYSGMYAIYDDAGNWMPCDITDEAKSARAFLQAPLVNTGQYSASTGIYDNLWVNSYQKYGPAIPFCLIWMICHSVVKVSSRSRERPCFCGHRAIRTFT